MDEDDLDAARRYVDRAEDYGRDDVPLALQFANSYALLSIADSLAKLAPVLGFPRRITLGTEEGR